MYREIPADSGRLAWARLLLWTLAIAIPSAVDAEVASRDCVAILKDDLPGLDTELADALAAALRGAGLRTEFLSADAVCDRQTLCASRHFLYVLPNAKCYPGAGVDVLEGYLRDRGSLLILGVPPSENPAWKHQGGWIDRNEVLATLARQKPARMLFDFDAVREPTGWRRGLGAPAGGVVEVVAGGADGSPACMQITFQHNDFASYDAWSAAFERDSTLGPRPLVCFWAKGDDRTPQLAVRLSHGPSKAEEGVAVVPLETTWRHYVLRQEDFGHLGQADTANATRISLSPCCDMVSRNILAQGAHRVWIDQIAMAPNPLAELGDTQRSGLPPIETVSPGYKRYPLQNVDSLRLAPSAGELGHGDWKGLAPAAGGPGLVSSCYVRPEGKGFQRGYQWRWIPLVQVHDAQGEQRGTVAWMLLHRKPLDEGPAFRDAVRRALGARQEQPPAVSREGSVCAVCATADTDMLQGFLRSGLVTEMAQRIRRGLFLSHAGSEHFAYWPGEKICLGAVAVNYGARQATVRVRVRVSAEDAGPCVFDKATDVTIAPGQSATAAWEWTPRVWLGDHYVATTELLHDGKPIDRIAHEVGVLSQEKPARDAFVTVKEGEFWVEGKRFYPVGVNYWPRCAMGLAAEDYVYHWLTPGFYNPEEVERDLRLLSRPALPISGERPREPRIPAVSAGIRGEERSSTAPASIESLGANFVIIRANAELDVRTLPDFLRRCRNHGIRVMAMLQSHVITDDPHYFQAVTLPFHFQEEVVAEFLRATRLVDNPTLLGYDIIWEPSWVFGSAQTMFGGDSTPYRQRWDDDWSKWIADRYGSLAAAEADWGVPAPRLNGRVTSPSNEQMKTDGPWRVMVAAYRRFMDDRMSRFFNDATRKLRRLDPRHLVSFRQGSISPQDFAMTGTGKHVDFVSMEGYRFRPSEDQVGFHAVRFATRFNQCMTKGKPVVWVEFGPTVWDWTSMQPRDRLIDLQQQCHELIYRAALECGANGTAPWWWAGGYRVTERSDHGIVEPDGTPRPTALMLKEYAPLFHTQRDVRPPDAWFTVDRDRHPGSHWYMTFHDGAEAFRQAAAEGTRLGVRTAGEGSTSADTPLVAVGNTQYNGNNPPKYLDAEFNWLKIKVGDGPWIEVTDGATIRAGRNTPIVAAASVGNLQAATWLTPGSCRGRPGAVWLASTDASELSVKVPLPRDTARLEDADFGPAFPLTAGVSSAVKIELRMNAEGRAWFGEKLRFALEPDGNP